MSKVRMLAMGLVTLGAAAAAYRVMAERKYFGPARFIDAASAKGLGEIEAARLALQKGQSESVRTFAQQMIEEHTTINRELRQIARNKGYEMADEADMLSKTEEMLLNLRESNAFDQAYVKHQIASHEHALSLFRRAADFDDFDVSNFAMKTRPRLEHHLKMAKDIQNDTEQDKPAASQSKQSGSSAGSSSATGAAPEKDVAAGTANSYASSDIGGTTHNSSGPNPGGGMPPNSAAGSSTGSTQAGPADSPTSISGSPDKGPSDKASPNLPGHTGGDR